MENQKKILTRMQLINWHYFENERIAMNGPTLISGENTAGKSTILDAIQLVLTTNTRKFNVAANEKGNRTLKGYVRCKVGNVGEAYLRKNVVPANVALEFYEEKGERYFVIGVHLLSADEESAVVTRWYVEECRLEDLSFIVEDRPALAEEFKMKGKKIRYIDQKNAARDRFRRRLGNLDDKFFDIIPKSLAFKPMDNVKDFINKFVLSEEKIDVEVLRENIETLSELEEVLERSRKKSESLSNILLKQEEIEQKEKDIRINQLLLDFATRDSLKEKLEKTEQEIENKKLVIQSNQEQLEQMDKQLEKLKEQEIAISIAISSNSSNKLVETINRKIKNLESEISTKEIENGKLKEQIQALKFYVRDLKEIEYKPLTIDEVRQLGEEIESDIKNEIVERLEIFEREHSDDLQKQRANYQLQYDKISRKISELQANLQKLQKKDLPYPDCTKKLKEEIEKEFKNRRISSKVYILCELLEITDDKWVNAVEGYFNNQKFYLIVEPKYYDIALEVYHKNLKYIHTAGIVNTKKIQLHSAVTNQSLAYVVKSENRYAKAYSDYILGRVVRCERVEELEEHKIAITSDCMLYQGYVVRHLDPENYHDPYIGQNAYRTQIVNVKKEIEENAILRGKIREDINRYNTILESRKKLNIGFLKQYLNSPNILRDLKQQLEKAKVELKEASNNPEWIELNIKYEETKTKRSKIENERKDLDKSNTRLVVQVENKQRESETGKVELEDKKKYIEQQIDIDGICVKEAEEKYLFNRKTKSAKTIADNFAPQRSQYFNEKNVMISQLRDLQNRFNMEFNQDYKIGLEEISEYREAKRKLESVEIVKYEEKLKKVKEECQEIFRSDFLSKMKEHIEVAKNEFKNLNKALRDIYYGEDSYYFKISFNKKKEGLYRMITSDNNQEGYNLWSSAFESEYQEEMEELFAKLTAKDDKGQKVVEEYTDYRSYLDYDIEIHKKDGSVQRFSDIYGEKSGSETQVPYYVAIAASFYQLYHYGNSIRIMLLDEAFDKMDDERIQSMMEFFNGLELQVIMATPPSKIEVIGEKVDTILTAIRVGKNSIVEEYDF